MYRTPLTGSIYLINDLQMAANGLMDNNTRVITLTEQPEYTMYMPNVLQGTILLPPYEAMIALSDNNRQLFSQIYYSYLASSMDIDHMVTIITGAVLLKGMNILLFIPMDEMELDFFKDLSAFIYATCGILIGTPQNPFAYQPCFDAMNLQKMYYFNLLSYQDVILEYPANERIPFPVCNKILTDMGIAEQIPLNQYEQWVYGYVNQIKQAGNVFRIRGVIKPCS